MGIVIGTAGHVDHGKSALVKALTGCDPDRLEEEKRRGITIELGYVHMPLPGGGVLSFIDVPGHEKFVRTMVAGVATVDMFLLVVSADEGVMPQTDEHLDILRLLKVDRGMVVLSKCDLVEDELQELAEEEIREALRGSPAENVPIVRVSSVTGRGIEELREKLIEITGNVVERDSGRSFRMPVDRIFTLKGFGTIACGTGLSGTVRVNDMLEQQPGGKIYRVRELGVNNSRSVKSGGAGDRIALNLVGLDKDDVRRGDCFGTPGSLTSLSSVDTHCTMLEGGADLKLRQRVRFHVGTAEVMARAIPVDGSTVSRGTAGYVHFQLEHPVVAMPEDRFVIRRYSPIITIGGGVIIETGTRKVRSKYRDERIHRLDLLSSGNVLGILEGMLAENPLMGFSISDAIGETAVSGEDLDAVIEVLIEENMAVPMKDGSDDRVVSSVEVNRISAELVSIIGEYHAGNPLSYGLPVARISRLLPKGIPPWFIRSVISLLEEKNLLVRRGGDRLALSSHPEAIPGEMIGRVEAYIEKVMDAGPAGMVADESDCLLVDSLIERGLLINLDKNLAAAPGVVDKVVHLIAESFGPEGFRLGELREALGVSRKIALMWAEYLDSIGKTQRKGELRFLINA